MLMQVILIAVLAWWWWSAAPVVEVHHGHSGSADGPHVKLFIGLNSAPQNGAKRQVLRETWLSDVADR